jgi:hypothetical protein
MVMIYGLFRPSLSFVVLQLVLKAECIRSETCRRYLLYAPVAQPDQLGVCHGQTNK